jgi:hypothetical protein
MVSQLISHVYITCPLMLLLGLLGLSGCATLSDHPEDAGDVCAAQRAELRGGENYFAQDMIKGFVAGAAAAAGTSFLGGLISGKKPDTKDTVKMAAIGGVAGAIGGYFLAKQKVTTEANALADSIAQDIEKENGEIEKADIAFVKLRQCRFATAAQVKADYKAGRISRSEAESRLNNIRQRFEEDIRIAESINVKATDRAKEFQFASDQLLQKDPIAKQEVEVLQPTLVEPKVTTRKPRGPKPTAQPTRPAAKVAVQTLDNLNHRQRLDKNIQTAQAEASGQFALEGTV